MAPKTLRNILVVLRRALGQAVRAGLVSKNVASREFVDAPKVPLGDPPALTVDEIARIRAVLPGHALEIHVIVALGTGLRQGEQLGLAWEDVAGDRLHVRKELTRLNGRYERVDPKTDRSKRTIQLAPTVQDAFTRQRLALIVQGFVPTSTGPVFVNTKGKPLSGSWLTHRWYDLLEEAGVERKPWKVMRATFGSRLFADGVPDRVIADFLGHSRTATTHRHYIATSGEGALEAIGRMIG